MVRVAFLWVKLKTGLVSKMSRVFETGFEVNDHLGRLQVHSFVRLEKRQRATTQTKLKSHWMRKELKFIRFLILVLNVEAATKHSRKQRKNRKRRHWRASRILILLKLKCYISFGVNWYVWHNSVMYKVSRISTHSFTEGVGAACVQVRNTRNMQWFYYWLRVKFSKL